MTASFETDPTSTAVFGSLDLSGEQPVMVTGLSAADAAAVAALPAGTALLVVQHGPTTGARFLLDASRVTVGRHPKADIFLDDVTVSRKHAVFELVDSSYVIRDGGSLNGTYVNRERVDEAVLNPGDEVQIGKYRMSYHPSPVAS